MNTPRKWRPDASNSGRPHYLSDTERDLIRLAQEPGFPRWTEQIKSAGGCAHPIYLSGRTTTATDTGILIRHYDTANEPGGRLAVRCRNRRETRCQPCSYLHAGDTFHLVRSGLIGGKEIPAHVTGHPRLFVTLTAPSFGAVHRTTSGTSRCRLTRDHSTCEHGQPRQCGLIHASDDPLTGQPLCPDCYDYTSHVLWHAHAGVLWNRTATAVRRHLASAGGVTQSKLPTLVRLSFAKVAEYQRRGAVHFHAVIRLDGPQGPESAPPEWASAALLTQATRTAVKAVQAPMRHAPALGDRVFVWGSQIDVHTIRRALDGGPVTEEAVAAYVAKYTSKSVSDSGGLDQPVTSAEEITLAPVSAHLRALMGTCWRLGGLAELEHLRLRPWTHTLGYRGHVLTKSRKYSTTYRALRDARTAHHQSDSPATAEEIGSVSEWRYVGSGHTPAESEVAAGVAQDLCDLREIKRTLRL
ncbi:replication initiator [Streptomyces niveus]|uniref:Plasmid replication initiator protein n=1 Tax=Streptomyces niveus TaxID=193462 RepID=A0A1U9QWI7_STRNV|nr:replication initiator [Streptomyces niveus]AQU68537.1 plasmid replication initiator protein [Streptomyces niveus]